jgi:hypothetical protein
MSVQRWTNTENAVMVAHGEGRYVRYDDHVAALAGGAKWVFAFHPEWTVTGMCHSDCLACRRLTELITERAKGYEEGKQEAAPRTLTADDPEPAVGSVVLDAHGQAWQREDGYPLIRWVSSGDVAGFEWTHVASEFGPVRLIHDGEAK